jgi:hypothetical protein
MIVNHTFEISGALIAFICISAMLIAGLMIVMHLRRTYHPSLIGALIGGFLCFLLLEALPALT